MKYHPGDKVRIVCNAVGTVKEDPTGSCFTILVDFNGQLARIPQEGGVCGIRAIKLELVKEEALEST